MKKLLPIFDSFEYLQNQDFSHLGEGYFLEDIKKACHFLKSYRGSSGTFNSYRSEVEHLLQYSALIAQKPLKEFKREDIDSFIEFSKNPPKHWIGTHKPPRFIDKEYKREPNKDWRPYLVTISKTANRKGDKPDIKNFELKQGALKQIFAILSSFFNYLLQEDYVSINPVALIRQKSKFIRKIQEKPKIRRLSELQWDYVITKARENADNHKNKYYERSLFMMSCLYLMYLRISELSASSRWQPKMSDFFKDNEGNWWFLTVGKGNKQRQIAVSDSMLEALKRWRKFLNLSPNLPTVSDSYPLFPKTLGKGAITSTTYIRKVIQECFDNAIISLKNDGFEHESEELIDATVHWLRHTGISDDVKNRPKEHVRDDAGHSSSAITDRYIDIELNERHRSAKNKQLQS